MKVAVLADIHGNLPALEAVLAEVDVAAPDLVVVCGDVASGPLPAETIDLLRALPGARFVQGNADRGLVTSFDGGRQSRLPGPAADWAAAQLSREQRDFLASFSATVAVDVDGLGRVLFCHGSPRSDEEMMTSETADERLREFMAGVDADVVVCGHTHMPFDRTSGSVRVINPGSVGMPYGEPGAHWALLGSEIEMRRTDYDRNAAAQRIRQSAWPGAEQFATSNVLSVPSKEEAFAFFRAHGGP
ncbi:MAG TPA: metallophosphoesterase family protein [Candidatus Dormibacteraeota bacterium]|nr:metallophosphoesterase family protein [Candidatus Dormibacteraeota bacterium]